MQPNPTRLVRRRLRRGWSFAQAIGMDEPPLLPWAKAMTHDGITESISGWARILGVSGTRIWKRRAAGESVAEALSTTPRSRRLGSVEYNGQSHTVREWGRMLGMNPRTIMSRIDHGWTVERALGTPLKPRATPRRRTAAASPV